MNDTSLSTTLMINHCTPSLIQACGYIRGSTEQQQNTLVAQEQQIAGYCQFKGLEVARYFTDSGESAFSTSFYERPQAAEMLAWMHEHDVRAIVFTKLDRGFRDALDCLFTVDDLNRRGVHLHILDIQLDTSTPVGKLVLTVMAAIAEFENRRRSERQKAANAVKRARGERCGNIPYGWDAIPSPRKSKTGRDAEDLVPNRLEQTVLRLICEEWKTESCNEVARRLNQRGTPAKKGGKWFGATVSSVREHALMAQGQHQPSSLHALTDLPDLSFNTTPCLRRR